MKTVTVERRIDKRIDVNIKADLSFRDYQSKGRVRNISGNGMLVITKDLPVPMRWNFDISLPLEGSVIKVPARLMWIKLSPDTENQLGVIIRDPSKSYLEFVGRKLLS